MDKVVVNPDIVLVKDHQVFHSEKRLYGSSKELNHRRATCHASVVYSKLFETSDNTILFSLLVKGATSMRDKLLHYAAKQLPGGIYWDPEPAIRTILVQLEPSNDFCESILGLNDYLTSAIPNLTQASCSNLVQLKKIILYNGLIVFLKNNKKK